MITFQQLDLPANCHHWCEFINVHNQLFKITNMSRDWLGWFIRLGMLKQSDESEIYKSYPENRILDYAIDKIQPHSSQIRFYGAFDDSSLVGIWCVEPKCLKYSYSTLLRVGRCFAVGILPDYRRKNLFVELSQYAIEQERIKGEYEFILGFPQQNHPVIDAHLKSGWNHVTDINVMHWQPTYTMPAMTKVDSKLKYVAQINYGDKAEDTRNLRGHTDMEKFNSTLEYRYQRWSHHPENLYTCLRHSTTDIVIKFYKSAMHILDIYGTGIYNPHSGLKPLVATLQSLAIQHACSEITTWCHVKDESLQCFKAAGFRNGSTIIKPVSILAVNINAKVPLELSKPRFGMGVEEIY